MSRKLVIVEHLSGKELNERAIASRRDDGMTSVAEQLGPTSIAEQLAANIAIHRVSRRWTQAGLAEKLRPHGLRWDAATVSKVESQFRQVTATEFVVLARLFDVPLTDLLAPSTIVVVPT